MLQCLRYNSENDGVLTVQQRILCSVKYSSEYDEVCKLEQ